MLLGSGLAFSTSYVSQNHYTVAIFNPLYEQGYFQIQSLTGSIADVSVSVYQSLECHY